MLTKKTKYLNAVNLVTQSYVGLLVVVLKMKIYIL